MQIDTTIVGAGVIGLAVAARLSERRQPLFVVERNASFGQETSSRNSEVIHAGIYYPAGSLKARLCVRGREALYQRLEEARIPHRRCGKLLVATEAAEADQLDSIRQRAADNGVDDLERLSGAGVRALEPQVRAVEALLSPSTGILDSHRLMRHLLSRARRKGCELVYRTKVERIRPRDGGGFDVLVRYPDGAQDCFFSRHVVNCAGLAADQVAASAGIDIDAHGYRLHLWKGAYFNCQAPSGYLKRLVYPVPPPHTVGLGIHATIDLIGRIRFGPDATYLPDGVLDYAVNSDDRDRFFHAAARYLPSLQADWLQPEMAGIRPKLQQPGDAVRDFVISEESGKGLPGLVNCIGIESPGLTSCLAIAEYVADLLE
ncbi:MAG: NAD(P)/FAD-dependent oxidoreductase [Desulfosarcinaceae bacterium]|nr:NAD(P)/FAD-dependent oxidoreductase [Desulfosarcinaceae bacterium]